MPRHKLKENEGKDLVRLNVQLPKDMLQEAQAIFEEIDGTTLSQFIRKALKARIARESRKAKNQK